MMTRILLLIILFCICHSMAWAANPALKFEPETITVEKDKQFSINVVAEDLTELFGTSFELSFDEELLESVDATAGNFLGEDVIFFKMPSAGKISIAISKKAGDKAAAGLGMLASVKFKAKADGETDIIFNPKTLSLQQSDGSPIPRFGDLVLSKCHVTIGNGIAALAIRILPPVKSVEMTDEFSLDVVVENVTDLFSGSFELNFDGEILKMIKATAGDFLGTDVIFFSMPDSGKISVAITKKAGSPPVSGSGVLAKITFKRLKAESVNITFRSDTLSLQQANGELIAGFEHLVIEKGHVNTGTTAVEPKGKLITRWSRLKAIY